MIHGDRVTLRPLAEADLPRIVEIVNHPEIVRWWTAHDADRLHRELFEDPCVVPFVIEFAGDAVGLIEYTEETDPDYRSAGIDIALDAAHLGQGLGTDAIRALADYLFAERGHHRLTMDPAMANERAIAAYRRAGFKPVGVMRQYERAASGEWRDALLMDMVRDEFEAEGSHRSGRAEQRSQAGKRGGVAANPRRGGS